jgi:hypothetical protein
MLAELFNLFVGNVLQLPGLISRFELTVARLGWVIWLLPHIVPLCSCQAVVILLLSSNSASTVTGRMCLEIIRGLSRAGAIINLELCFDF